jgi:nicotinamide-nucleotide amidase
MSDEKLEVILGEMLNRRGLRLAVAESCTGGLVGHRITNVPGSSDYFLGGVIAYANEVKERVLGVRKETLEKFGAVSAETAIEMSQGVCRLLRADIGVAITGIAGPGGGSLDKPVGLTWIGLSAVSFGKAWRYTWSGNRSSVKEKSANQVLRLVVAYLEDQLPI